LSNEHTSPWALVQQVAAAEVGALSVPDLLLLGAVAYWCEGAKSKPWRPNDCRVVFVNSDPVLLALFLRFLGTQGVRPEDVDYRVAIHESADAAEATSWWAARLGLQVAWFQRPTLKRHMPRTTRYNTGEDYHGCLTITVRRGRELYWRIEGIMAGILTALAEPDTAVEG
jgi:hypothetical protein